MTELFRIDTLNAPEEAEIGFVCVPGFDPRLLADQTPDPLSKFIAEKNPAAVVVQSHRFNGGSENSEGLKDDPQGWEQIVENLNAAVEALVARVNKVIVAGNSFGANFAAASGTNTRAGLLMISPVTNVTDQLAWVENDQGFIQFGPKPTTMHPNIIKESQAFSGRFAGLIDHTPTTLIDVKGDPLVDRGLHLALDLELENLAHHTINSQVTAEEIKAGKIPHGFISKDLFKEALGSKIKTLVGRIDSQSA